jgi:hypothetical protein
MKNEFCLGLLLPVTYTLVFKKDLINLPSNNDIQHSFVKRGYQQIDSYIHKESDSVWWWV